MDQAVTKDHVKWLDGLRRLAIVLVLIGALLCILEKEGRLPLDGSFVICLVVAAILGLTGIFAVNSDG